MIEETICHALEWCDKIFVFDNGSTDATWSIVKNIALHDTRVVPYRSAAVPYRDSLRSEVFNQFRDLCTEGDWWCKLDADEIYHDDPRNFLSRVPLHHHVVWGVNFQFYFTDVDAEHWELDDRAYPPHTAASQALKYYRCEWSEVRFFRYRRRLTWTQGSAPMHLGVVHPRRIRFRHYQYRSPAQIDLRLQTRQAAIASGCGTFQGYNSESSWAEKVVPATSCLEYLPGGDLQIDDRKIPWHIEPSHIRLAKRVMHGVRLWP